MNLSERGTDFAEFWRERHLCTLTTVRPDGTPHVVPVGATLDLENGIARVITSAGSHKARLIAARRAAASALCQVDGRRWSTLEGIATIRTGREEVADAERRYAARYRTPRPNPDRVVAGDSRSPASSARMITVVGIGADGWAGLSPASRRAIAGAEVLFGSRRQLDLVPDPVPDGARARAPWPVAVLLPSPLLPKLPTAAGVARGREVCVLASGDPMFYGIGRTLVRLLGADRRAGAAAPVVGVARLRPARLAGRGGRGGQRWSAARSPRCGRALHARRRVLVLSAGPAPRPRSPRCSARRASAPSRVTVLAQLGAEPSARSTAPPTTGRTPGPACTSSPSSAPPRRAPCRCRRCPGCPTTPTSTTASSPSARSAPSRCPRLAPLPGELLWDVGARRGQHRDRVDAHAPLVPGRGRRARPGAGRAHPAATPRRSACPRCTWSPAPRPDALDGLPAPDAVFIGGGLTAPGLIERCWAALRPGGRLVANAVTLESEAVLADWYRALRRRPGPARVQQAAPVGGFTGWRPAMPVTQWA